MADSDVDLRGAAVPPRRVLYGYRRGWEGRWEQADARGDMEVFRALLSPEEAAAPGGVEGSVYDLRKLFALAAGCNPNLIEVLFCRDADLRLCTPVGARLRAAAPLFLSQRARHSFGGYAKAQLQRIRTHRRWLLDPPPGPPPKGAPDFERRLQEWKQLLHWRASRNPARAELEARSGYDTKHGAHLVRLLRMGREILVEGRAHVWRGEGGAGDREELRAIRGGAWPYDQLVAWAEEADAELDRVLVEGRAVVPPLPDEEALDALCAELVEAALAAGEGA